jgi:hypothetical protein
MSKTQLRRVFAFSYSPAVAPFFLNITRDTRWLFVRTLTLSWRDLTLAVVVRS